MSNKIAIVVAYFGKFPNYFPLWLKSCAYNATIDFFLFTDQQLENLPQNVKHVPMSLSEMQDRASDVLGFKAVLTKPYKCCDYRPLYGALFKDYLATYDYWGHCDVDLIFGDLQYFFDKYNLYDYDKFGTLGHLSLFRNCEKVNNAYKLAGDNGRPGYREVFTNERNFTFDELSGISMTMIEHGFKVFPQRLFVDIATSYKRYRFANIYPLDNGMTNYSIQTFIWKNGKTYHIFEKSNQIQKCEYIYVHFQKRPNYEITKDLVESSGFYITNTGFHILDKEISRDKILELNPYKGKLYEILEHNCHIWNRKIKNRLKNFFQ